jgi:hypothetical protein
LIFKVAETEEEVRSALSILHDSYVEVGLMNEEPTRLRLTKVHKEPTSIILIAKLQEQVVGTVTICGIQ